MDINDFYSYTKKNKNLKNHKNTSMADSGTIKFEDNSLFPPTGLPNRHILSQSVEQKGYNNLVNYRA